MFARCRIRRIPRMLDILLITVPIYVLMGLGYVAGRSGMLAASEMRALGKFVVNFALPALLFRALSQKPIREIFDGRYLLAYALGSLVVFAGAFALTRYARHKDVPYSSMFAMGASFSNSGFVGYPIVLQWLGPPAGVALALCMIVENLIMMPLALAVAESGGVHGDDWRKAARKSFAMIIRNPMVISIFAGFAVALLGIPLPDWFNKSIGLLANASTAVALFVIGGALVGLEPRGMLGEASAVAFGKLVVHPLVVFGFVLLTAPVDAKMRAAAVAYAAAPMLSIYPILAQKYGYERFCAAALVGATVISIVTVSAILWALSAVLAWV
jgi:predicted permease